MKPENLLTEFRYENGGLTRISTGRRGNKRPDGYIQFRFNGRVYGEHRLIHFIFTGEWPLQIDHINGVRWDNRHENLRAATNAQNCMNRKSSRLISKGCYWIEKRKRWMVQITINKKRKTIGYFKSYDEAAQVYMAMAKENYGEFARAL